MRMGKNKTERDKGSRIWRWACWDRTYVRIGCGGPCSRTDAYAAARAFRIKNSATKICVVGIENKPNTHEGFVRLDTGKWTPMGSPAARLPLLGLALTQTIGEFIANALASFEIGLSDKTLRVTKGFSEHKVTIKLNGGATGGVGGKGGGSGGKAGTGYYVAWYDSAGDLQGWMKTVSENAANAQRDEMNKTLKSQGGWAVSTNAPPSH